MPRKDKVAFITISRFDGSDGTISCMVNTFNDPDSVPGKKAAVEHKDFVPIKMKKIEFGPNEVEYRLEIEMPDCEEDGEDVELEEADTVSFGLQLSQPTPAGVKLSKKSMLFIDIEATDENAEQAADYERRKMLDYFLGTKDITWGQQFKIACILGPSIDQDNLVVQEVSAGAALWHFLAIFWKIFGALVPPRSSWGGWAAFLVALSLIGAVTTIIG